MRPPRPLLPLAGLPLGGLLAGGLLLTAVVAAVPVRAQSSSSSAPSSVAPSAPPAREPQPPPPPLNPGWAFDPTGPFQPGAADAPLLLPGNAGRFNPNARPTLAIGAPLPLVPPCPLIVPPRDAALQPLHLPPAAVPLKNRFGCLSAADAIYGPDGCPKRLCGKAAESVIRLPPGGP